MSHIKTSSEAEGAGKDPHQVSVLSLLSPVSGNSGNDHHQVSVGNLLSPVSGSSGNSHQQMSVLCHLSQVVVGRPSPGECWESVVTYLR